MTGNRSHIQKIVALFGGQTSLAKAIGRSQGTIWEWVEKGRIPSARIPEVIEAAKHLRPPVHLTPNHFFGAADVPTRNDIAA